MEVFTGLFIEPDGPVTLKYGLIILKVPLGELRLIPPVEYMPDPDVVP